MPVSTYRSRPVTVEAIQWTGPENCAEVFAFLDMTHDGDETNHDEIHGIGENETAHHGDWIVRVVDPPQYAGRESVVADEDFHDEFKTAGNE